MGARKFCHLRASDRCRIRFFRGVKRPIDENGAGTRVTLSLKTGGGKSEGEENERVPHTRAGVSLKGTLNELGHENRSLFLSFSFERAAHMSSPAADRAVK